jgi:hypothetical protein
MISKESAQYRFVGLSLSDTGLTEYVTKNELEFPIYAGLSPETIKSYKLGGTPQTIVISPEGKVLQDWAGAYGQIHVKERFNLIFLLADGLKELPVAKAAEN